MSECPHCHNDNPEGNVSCESCGAPLDTQSPDVDVPDRTAGIDDDLGREIGSMLMEGRKIEAIKHYRDATGCAKTAKECDRATGS